MSINGQPNGSAAAHVTAVTIRSGSSRGVYAITQMTDRQLTDHMLKLTVNTAQGLAQQAEVFQEMTRRGLDTTRFASAVSEYYAAITQGRITPEIVYSLTGRPIALAAMLQLDLASQTKVFNDGYLNVARPAGVQRVPLTQLTRADIDTAIRAGAVVPASKQVPKAVVTKTRIASPNVTVGVAFSPKDHSRLTAIATKAGLTLKQWLHKKALGLIP